MKPILLVEDEAGVRQLVRRVLVQIGYDVIEAATGTAALDVWREAKERIDLVITDLVMPDGMSGFELGEHLARERPALPIIYTSGYSAGLSGAGDMLHEGVNFLAKPFDIERIISIVRVALESRM